MGCLALVWSWLGTHFSLASKQSWLAHKHSLATCELAGGSHSKAGAARADSACGEGPGPAALEKARGRQGQGLSCSSSSHTALQERPASSSMFYNSQGRGLRASAPNHSQALTGTPLHGHVVSVLVLEEAGEKDSSLCST